MKGNRRAFIPYDTPPSSNKKNDPYQKNSTQNNNYG